VKRIDLVYGGRDYSVSGRELADLQQEIASALATSGGGWLRVNVGEGAPRTTYLLISPGVPLSLIPIDSGAV
jgi:hypothetical protein